MRHNDLKSLLLGVSLAVPIVVALLAAVLLLAGPPGRAGPTPGHVPPPPRHR